TVNFGTDPRIAPPLNSKLSFSPSSLTQSGTVTLTLDTSGNGHVASAVPLSLGPGRFVVVFAALLLPLLLWTRRTRWARPRARACLLAGTMCISGILLLAALSGCGSGHVTPLPPPPVVTPPGAYNVFMTATSSNTNVPPQTVPLIVIVK